MQNKTEAVKVTLRPTQIQKVKRVAKKDYDGNFSLCLRVMIDKFEDGTCETCVFWDNGHCDKNIADDSDEDYNLLMDITSSDFGCNMWEAKEEE